jgi:hypothetical protein
MAKSIARWINYDIQTLAGTSTLTVYLKDTGGLEKTADGIQVKSLGISNEMLAGSIGLDKLVKAVIAADGSVAFTGNQDMGGNKLTNLGPASNASDAVTLAQLQSWTAGLDFQADVLNVQVDSTLDPGTPNNGDRYIISDASNTHANFGTITGLENNDIVEYNSTAGEFQVVYDVSQAGEGALVWSRADSFFVFYDGSIWQQHGGLTGVSAGDGLEKIGNEIKVVVSDFAGTGLEDSGSNDLQLSTQGNGIAGGGGTLLSVDPDNITGGDIAPVTVGTDGVGVDVTALDGDHLTVDYTPVNYTPSDTPAEAADVDDLAAHLSGIDNALVDAGGSNLQTIYKELDATIIANGFFTVSFNVESPELVYINPVGGPQQINKQAVGSTGITPDYDVLNSNEIHINNNGSASGLSDVFQTGDVIMIQYASE